METATLEKQWKKIDLNSDHRSVRLAADCTPNLYIGFDNHNNRRLILSLPGEISFDINDDIREYIAIQYFDISRHLIVTLQEERFLEVFNAFILSVFDKIKNLDRPLQAASEMVQIYVDWNEFFTERTQHRLGLPEVMGLFGELFVLHQQLQEANAMTINGCLKSWVGPYGRGHDFVYDALDVEVKTIDRTKTDIVISSEHQLEAAPGKELHLKVFKVEINGQDGMRLSGLINEVRSIIAEKLGDLPLFLRGLHKAGVPIHQAQEYDQYMFAIREELCYDCNREGFPKLSVSNIPNAVSALQYKLKTTLLTDYLIEQKQC